MDSISIIQNFFTSVDVAPIIGIIFIVWFVRASLEKSKRQITLSDTTWRLIVLGLGAGFALLKVDYHHGFLAEAGELIGKAFTYGGASTLLYQLLRAGWKKIFTDEPPATPQA